MTRRRRVVPLRVLPVEHVVLRRKPVEIPTELPSVRIREPEPKEVRRRDVSQLGNGQRADNAVRYDVDRGLAGKLRRKIRIEHFSGNLETFELIVQIVDDDDRAIVV